MTTTTEPQKNLFELIGKNLPIVREAFQRGGEVPEAEMEQASVAFIREQFEGAAYEIFHSHGRKMLAAGLVIWAAAGIGLGLHGETVLVQIVGALPGFALATRGFMRRNSVVDYYRPYRRQMGSSARGARPLATAPGHEKMYDLAQARIDRFALQRIKETPAPVGTVSSGLNASPAPT